MPLRNELVFVVLAQLSCDFESYFACSFVSYHRNANKTFFIVEFVFNLLLVLGASSDTK